MSKAITTAPGGDPRLTGFLSQLADFHLGRTSLYGLERYAIFHRKALEAQAASKDVSAAGLALRGRSLRLLGRLREAKTPLDAAARLEPGLAAARAWRWELKLAAGLAPNPVDIDAAIEAEPSSPWWRIWRAAGGLTALWRQEGKGQQTKKELQRVAEELERALELDAACGLGWGCLAAVRDQQGDAEGSLAAADKLVTLEPRQGWVRHLRFRLRLEAGDREGAARDAERAVVLDEGTGYFEPLVRGVQHVSVPLLNRSANDFLEKNPGLHWAYVLRGNLRRSPEINDFTGALRDFQRAVELSPDCSWAWAYFCRALLQARRGPQALEAAGRAIELEPDCGWFRVWRGEARRRLGDPSAAVKDFTKGLELDANYEFGYAWRGGAYRSLGRYEESLSDLDLAVPLDPAYAWSFHERSLTLRALRRTDEAFADLEKACRVDPKFAWCSDKKGAPSALKELEQVIKRRPRSAWARAWKGDTLIRLRDFEGAKKELDRALKLDPKLAWARAWRGRAKDELGDAAGALRDLELAVRQDPSYANAFAWKGRLLHRMGRLKQARRDLDRAVALDQRSSWIHLWKGELELQDKRQEESEAAFTRALELDAKSWQARCGRAKARLLRGAAEEALSDLEAALASEPECAEAAALLSKIQLPVLVEAKRWAKSGQHAEAARLCGEALKDNPRDEEALQLRADAYRCMGRYDLQVGDLQSLCLLRPRDVKAVVLRGVGRRTASDFAGALADAEEALLMKPEADGWTLKSEALRNLGRMDEAVAAADEAIGLDSTFSWARVVKAKALRQSGRAGMAAEECARALELSPNDAKAHAWRGDALRSLGRLEESLACLDKAVELEPTCAWALALRGEVKRELGRLEQGWLDVREAVRIDGQCSCAYDMLGADAPQVRQDPKYSWVYAWRGAIHRREKRWDLAAADLNTSVALDSNCSWALAWRGELLLSGGQHAAALSDLSVASRLTVMTEARRWLGQALCALGRCEQAQREFAAALETDSFDVWTLIAAGVCLENRGKKRQAEAILKRARRLAPSLFQPA